MTFRSECRYTIAPDRELAGWLSFGVDLRLPDEVPISDVVRLLGRQFDLEAEMNLDVVHFEAARRAALLSGAVRAGVLEGGVRRGC